MTSLLGNGSASVFWSLQVHGSTATLIRENWQCTILQKITETIWLVYTTESSQMFSNATPLIQEKG